jgi:hypothetical protein
MRSISTRTKEAYQRQQEDYAQKIEQRCKQMLLIRAKQIAPIRTATNLDFIMSSPTYQKALLGGYYKRVD